MLPTARMLAGLVWWSYRYLLTRSARPEVLADSEGKDSLSVLSERAISRHFEILYTLHTFVDLRRDINHEAKLSLKVRWVNMCESDQDFVFVNPLDNALRTAFDFHEFGWYLGSVFIQQTSLSLSFYDRVRELVNILWHNTYLFADSVQLLVVAQFQRQGKRISPW